MRKEHEKTFDAIEKLKEVELELHRLKNALELANKGIDAQRTWVGLDDIDLAGCGNQDEVSSARYWERVLMEKNK